MIRRTIVRTATLGTVLLFCGGVFAQTFTVNSRSTPTGDTLRLDQSIDVVYNVTATGLTQAVIPVLRPVNSAFADKMSVTWLGTSATTSLSNLSFRIHSYDDDSLCAQTIDFELAFYSTQFSGERIATPATSALMQFITTGGGQINLTHLINETSTLPYPLTSRSASTHFLLNTGVSQSVIQDPNNRIYLWCDYNLNGAPWSQQFHYWLYALNANFCSLNAPTELENLLNVQGDVVDQTVSPAAVVNQAPLGGAGTLPTLGEGINIFDITDIDPVDQDCVGTVRDSINYSSGIFQLLWSYGGFGMVVRRFALYVGTEGGCSAVTNIYGAPPSPDTFRIDDYTLDSYGNVSAALTVPSAWASGNTLNSDLRVSWYLRSNTSITALGGESQSLILQNVASGVDVDVPSNYYLEARIRQTSSNAMVSTDGRDYNHSLNYAMDPLDFAKSELVALNGSGPDEFFDPAEELTISFDISNVAGGALPSLTYDNGLVIDTNPNGIVDSSDTFLSRDTTTPDGVNIRFGGLQNSGGTSTNTITMNYELLTAHTLPAVWFYMDVDREDGNGTTSTFRNYVSIKELLGGVRDLNAEVTEEVYAYNFAQTPGADWSVDNTNSGSGTFGFAYNGSIWVGDGSDQSAARNDLYRLMTPVFPLGTSTSIYFEHLPQFSFNQSGGLLEYRTRVNSGTTWGSWENLIEDYCSNCGYYDSFPFPTQPSSYLSGKMVWMSNETTVQEVDVNLPDSLAQTRGEVQFRFVFTDPSLVSTGSPRSDGPTHWEVYNFEYQTTRLTEDNIFGVDTNALTMDACENPALTFLPWAPVNVANLTFEWFSSLDNLYDDVSTGDITGAAGLSVPFNPSANGEYHYYVRIKYQGAERILRVIVNKNGACTNTCLTSAQALQQILDDVSVSWPGVKNVTDCVIVINRICQ